MRVTIAILALLGSSQSPLAPSTARYREHLPVTIEVTRDVTVRPCPEQGRPPRGTMCTVPDVKSFVIKKGQTFEMTNYRGEGDCSVRFEKHDYEVVSCLWLEGFRDRETDVYHPIA